MVERRAATLQEVAREAGVSLATASRALNGSARRVNDEYRERVRAAAERLNYSPNTSAQAVARGRAKAIALVVSDIADPYFSSIAARVFRSAEEAGLIVTMAATERRAEREVEIVAALRSQKPQVLILVGSRTSDEASLLRLEDQLTAFEAEGGRVALITQDVLPFDTVSPRNEEGARRLAERMIGLGYRRFAVLAGPRDLLTAENRTSGFRAAIAAARLVLPDDAVIEGEFTRDGGYAAAAEVLRLSPRPELVLAVNDVMAVGFMAGLRDAGLEPPAAMAVAGFDDITTLRDISPALTTVRLPLEEMADAALELALNPAAERRLRRIPGDVVVRASTPPRG